LRETLCTPLLSAFILRSGPKDRVSKDGAAPWFETHRFAMLLTMRPGEIVA